MVAQFGRLSKGSRLQDAYQVPSPFPAITSLDSAFQLQEYISLLVKADVHDVHRIVALPTRRDDGSSTSSEEEGGISGASGDDEKTVDEYCWVYEQLRRVALDLSHPLLSTLQLECNRKTCPEMKADEWLYLCVAHGNGVESQCCAIDYIVHTLDSTTAVLNSPKSFPSRISILPASRRLFHSLSRRLSRIFAHAYYHHREAFETCEAESSLYARFYQLAKTFDLVPSEFLIPPPSPPSQSPAGSESASDDDPAFNRRASSHSLPRPDASALPSPKPSPGLTGHSESAIADVASPGSLNRTETMFLSSDVLGGIRQPDQTNWPKQSSNPDSGSDDELSPIDDDGYDIVEGLSSQGLGDMMQGIEDDEDAEPETNVVVDEMDGAGDGMPPVDSTHTPHSVEEADEMAHAVEEASKLPILHSGLSPGLSPQLDQVSFEVSSSPRSPLRSPRRGTLRQSDVSPSWGNRALPDFEEPAHMALPAVEAPTPFTAVSPSSILLQQDESRAASKIALPADSHPEELEEVDLSTGPGIVDEVDELEAKDKKAE